MFYCTKVILLISFPVEINGNIYSFLGRFDDQNEIKLKLKAKSSEEIIENSSLNIFKENNQIKEMFTINLGMLVNIFIKILF